MESKLDKFTSEYLIIRILMRVQIMMINVVPCDDQPISATFFGEGHWLSDFVTPEEPDILMLYRSLTANATNINDKIDACWSWVANEVKYKNFISATINIEGVTSVQKDFWQTPAVCSKTKWGNCANKAFLLTSLLRNAMPSDKVHCVLGNLYNGHGAGHAWVEAELPGGSYIVEATRNDVPMILANTATRYEPVHYFNDKSVYAVPGRTVMTPFQACYSSWLAYYLDKAYIGEGD